MTMHSSISAHDDGSTTFLVLAGEIDPALRGPAGRALAAALTGDRPVVVDLRDVTFIDSSGVHFLVQCRRACHQVSLDCTLRNVPASAMYVLDVLGLREVLGLDSTPSRSAAWTTTQSRSAMPSPPATTTAACQVLRRGIEVVTGTTVAVSATADVAGTHQLLADLPGEPGTPSEHRAAWVVADDDTDPTSATVWSHQDDVVVCVSVRSASELDAGLFRDQLEAAATLLTTMVGDERARTGLTASLADLRAAMAVRAVIDQAKGVIMAQNHCSAQRAFDILRAASQHRDERVADVASLIVEQVTGSQPAPAPFNPRTSA